MVLLFSFTLFARIFSNEVFPAPEAPKIAVSYPGLQIPLKPSRIVLSINLFSPLEDLSGFGTFTLYVKF